jgi:hypothetical protein
MTGGINQWEALSLRLEKTIAKIKNYTLNETHEQNHCCAFRGTFSDSRMQR